MDDQGTNRDGGSHLEASRVPEAMQRWLGLAERWGIGDDFDRCNAVEAASESDLRELLSFEQDYDAACEWLAGPEAESSKPTREYIAFSDLAMAWQRARVIQKRRENNFPTT
jgi:hypothetical protein